MNYREIYMKRLCEVTGLSPEKAVLVLTRIHECNEMIAAGVEFTQYDNGMLDGLRECLHILGADYLLVDQATYRVLDVTV